jgi:hypothetical protein
MDSGFKGERRPSVAQVVKPDPGKPPSLDAMVELPADSFRVNRAATSKTEHQVLAALHTVHAVRPHLHPPVLSQHCGSRLVENERSPTLGCHGR